MIVKIFVTELRVVDTIVKPLKIYWNHLDAIFFLRKNKSDSWSTYIVIKHLVVRDHIKKNKVAIEHIKTNHMIIDPMTKGSSIKDFKDQVENMRLDCTIIKLKVLF